MNPTYTLRILWIDDKPHSEFIALTSENGIQTSVKTNVDDKSLHKI